MNVFLTVLLVAAVAADATFLWAYCWANPWWRSRVGRALVQQGASIAFLLGYAALRRVFGWQVIPALQLGLYVLVVAMLTGMAVAFVRERHAWRTTHRGEHR